MKENVVIIGGGVAGMEAAKQLLLLGYNPILVEQRDHLGGHVAQWNRLFPDRSSAQDFIRRLGGEIMEANIFLETKVTSINRLQDGYVVMLSSGVSIPCPASSCSTLRGKRNTDMACMTMSSRTQIWKPGSTALPTPVSLRRRRPSASSIAWAPATSRRGTPSARRYAA